jgi:mono/diheme cytochrome c family protein
MTVRAWPICGGMVAFLAGCTAPPPDAGSPEFAQTIRDAVIPAQLTTAEALFAVNCAPCHGERGLGSDRGPPLIDVIYEPSHHADIAFLMAAERGVRAHHWNFGDMPPQPQVEPAEMESIIAYVRYLQEQVGIR